MIKANTIEFYWSVLILITLLNTLIGERFSYTAIATIAIAFTVTYKGVVVIDHFMELKEGNKNLRFLMKLYFVVFPSLIIVSVIF